MDITSNGDSILDGVTSINDGQLFSRLYSGMYCAWFSLGLVSASLLQRHGFDSTQDASAGESITSNGDSILDGVTSINDEALSTGVYGALSGGNGLTRGT